MSETVQIEKVTETGLVLYDKEKAYENKQLWIEYGTTDLGKICEILEKDTKEYFAKKQEEEPQDFTISKVSNLNEVLYKECYEAEREYNMIYPYIVAKSKQNHVNTKNARIFLKDIIPLKAFKIGKIIDKMIQIEKIPESYFQDHKEIREQIETTEGVTRAKWYYELVLIGLAKMPPNIAFTQPEFITPDIGDSAPNFFNEENEVNE